MVQGSAPLVARLLHSSQADGVIHTACIERLNATFRQRLACLARRTRYLVREQTTLTAGMYIVGCFYNFCDEHESPTLATLDHGTPPSLGSTHPSDHCGHHGSLLDAKRITHVQGATATLDSATKAR